MRFTKVFLGVVGATVLLSALVSSASARNLSSSSLTKTILWRRGDFSGGFGTIECEVLLSGRYHTRTITKTTNSLIGYITEASILRCIRAGATMNRETLPWHLTYQGFGGTLPNITTAIVNLSGASWNIREPTFGATCRVNNATSVGTVTIAGGAVTRADISGTNRCGAFSGTLAGSETNVAERLGGARITITLI